MFLPREVVKTWFLAFIHLTNETSSQLLSWAPARHLGDSSAHHAARITLWYWVWL